MPGTDAPVGTLGAIPRAIDELKVEGDRILVGYLDDSTLEGTLTCGELDRILYAIRSTTEELRKVRFCRATPEECSTVSYLDDPAFVRAVRDVINQYREERKRK
jgi:hypothetical protein